MSRRARLLLGAIVVIGALAAAWRWTPLADYLTAEAIIGWAHRLRRNPWAPAALILAYTPGTMVMFPTPVLTLFAVLAFGAWPGAVYALAGIMVSATSLYSIGRFIRYEKLRRFASRGVEAARDLAHEHGILAVVAANFMPVPPFGVQCFIAGAVRMKYWEFAVGNLISRAPSVAATAIFTREFLAALDEDSGINYWLLVPAVVAFIALAVLGRRWAKRHEQKRRRQPA